MIPCNLHVRLRAHVAFKFYTSKSQNVVLRCPPLPKKWISYAVVKVVFNFNKTDKIESMPKLFKFSVHKKIQS